MTVVSVIVSGFICYHRQLAKVAEESAPEPVGATNAAQVHAAQVQTSMMLNFNAWFKQKQAANCVPHANYRQ